MKTTDTRRRILTFAGFLLLASLALIVDGGLSFAQDIECGAIIGPGKRIGLEQDLDCSEYFGGPALTVVGPVTFDLKRHTVKGNDLIDGIVIEGRRAFVRRGTLTGFYDGVILAGEGHHRVYVMRAIDNLGAGFVVEAGADYNRLTFNKSIDNGEYGYYVVSDYNYLAKNRSEACVDEGMILFGNNNHIYLNKAVNNKDGFEIKGDDNRFFYNGTKESQRDGIIIDGSRNNVYKNKAFGNGENGIVVDDDATDNKIVGNRVRENGLNGIFVEEGDFRIEQKNLITRNVAKDNGKANDELNTYYDLYDENGEATLNIWQDNEEGTKNPETID